MKTINKIKHNLDSFLAENDIHRYRELLEIADDFIENYPEGVLDINDLEIAIELLKELISINYIFSFKEYESDFDLEKEIRYKKIKVFKLCIPESHFKLRGMTELLLGMRENIVG